jgi:hypothetical protein
MCGGSAWVVEGWRPFADLLGDLDPAGVLPGVPLS